MDGQNVTVYLDPTTAAEQLQEIIAVLYPNGVPAQEFGQALNRAIDVFTAAVRALKKHEILVVDADGSKHRMHLADSVESSATKIAEPFQPAPAAVLPLERKIGPMVRPVAKLRELDLNNRARKALRRAGVKSVEDLTQHTRESLMTVPGLGPSTLHRIEVALEKVGATFHPDA